MTPSKSSESQHHDTATATATSMDSAPAGNHTVMWSVHVFASYALVKDINMEHDDVDNDDSYFITTHEHSGEKMATEWNPELRLGIKKAVDTIPHVFRQQWHYVGLDSIDHTLSEIEAFESDHDPDGHILIPSHFSGIQDTAKVLIKPVVMNFIDGMETDGWPGITIIKKLESRHLAFTGADSTLYYLDSDKALIKRHLVDTNTPTPGYYNIYSRLDEDMKAQQVKGNVVEEEDGELKKKEKTEDEKEMDREEEEMAQKALLYEGLSKLKFPLLVKPANSSSSRGISTKSVVDTPEEAYERAMETKRVWGPVYVEEYIAGREYTALVSGSSATGIKVYKVLERVFRSEIPERERMLTHDMKWGENNYGADETVKNAQWWMQTCSEADQERLQAIAKSIYASFGGNGYCRMDLREDHRSGEVYVVDVNANCSIDEDQDCAMGKILKSSGLTLGQFFSILMEDAIHVRDNLVAKFKGHAHSDLKNLATLAAIGGTKRPNASTAAEDGGSNKNIRISA